MNVFKSPSVPFAVIILTSALGWYVATLQETLSNKLAVVYAIKKTSGDTHSLTLQNISRSKVFSGVVFVTCSENPETCVLENQAPFYNTVEPFNLAAVTHLEAKNGRLRAELQIPSSATVEIKFTLHEASKGRHFLYQPAMSESLRIEDANGVRFYKSGLQSCIIKNFDAMIIWTFAISFMISAVIFLTHFSTWVCGKIRGEGT